MVLRHFFDVINDVLMTLSLTDKIFVRCIPRDGTDKKFYLSAETIGNPNGQGIFLAHVNEEKLEHFLLAKPLIPVPTTISKMQDIKTISNTKSPDVKTQTADSQPTSATEPQASSFQPPRVRLEDLDFGPPPDIEYFHDDDLLDEENEPPFW